MVVRALALFFALIFFAGCATTHKGPEAKKRQAISDTKYHTGQIQGSDREEDSFSNQWENTQDYSSGSLRQKETIAMQLSPRQIQTALKNAGYYKGPIDGKIGPKTKEAIRSFQKAKGLKADGMVGKRTTEKLSKYLN